DAAIQPARKQSCSASRPGEAEDAAAAKVLFPQAVACVLGGADEKHGTHRADGNLLSVRMILEAGNLIAFLGQRTGSQLLQIGEAMVGDRILLADGQFRAVGRK